MRLIQFLPADMPWIVAAIADGNDCPLRQLLLTDDATYQRHADAMHHLIFHAASQSSGPAALGEALCHQVSTEHRIFEFIKGPLRVLWFYGESNRLIVCSGGFVKKQQKVPRAELARAIKARQEYLAASARGHVRIEQEIWKP